MIVEVYWNLHKKCWSVRHKGKVILHKDEVYIKKPIFVVRPAGRERTRREKKKNVHAFVKGEMFGGKDFEGCTEPVRYNPYEMETFQDCEKNPVMSALVVYLGWDKIVLMKSIPK